MEDLARTQHQERCADGANVGRNIARDDNEIGDLAGRNRVRPL